MTEETLGTDRPHFRRLEPQNSDIIILRELNRTREELIGERTRHINRFRGLLWRYYPQFGELLGKKVSPWHLELWELVSSPDSSKRKRISTVQNLLRRNRRSIIQRLKVVDQQLAQTRESVNTVIEPMNERLRTEGEGPTDIEILRSIPGVGDVVLATLLAEAWDLIRRRDLKALRCLGGVAPVTKQSGKTKQVLRRKAVCKSLSYALHILGGIAIIYDQASKARYQELRAKSHGYCRSVRAVCDRLLSVACAILEKDELFDKKFKKPLRDAA